MHSSSSLFLFWMIFFLLFKFTFPSVSIPFLPAKNITLYGDAYFNSNAISLTKLACLSSSSSVSGVGRAFYVYPIRFLDSATNVTASFSCRFSFSIISSPSCPCGDGLAFLIASNADAFSPSNGYMGLPGSGLSAQDSFVAVEFDTSFDPSMGDINGNHIGVDVNSVISTTSVDAMTRGIDLKSGKKITAWIEYRDSEKLLRIWAGHSVTRPPGPLLAARIDLSKQFKEYMHIGFSASNGKGSATHVVRHWRFKTFVSYPSEPPVDTAEEGDCFMCSPEDTGTRSLLDHGKTKMHDVAFVLGGLAAIVFSIVAIVAMVGFLLIRKKRAAGKSKEDQTCRVQSNRAPTRLSLAEIKSATMGFHPKRILGKGASAIVYKGSLPSGGTVAVKRFQWTKRIDYALDPFTTEFATMVGCLRHKNLVQLQGWCCEGRELVLVYEYLPNGSLDKYLHRKSSSPNFLSWEQRLNVVLGVASALSYLHEECDRQVIHRDVKASNVMLDVEFNAKLGDFGLAEVYEHRSNARQPSLPAGTIGYLAPEYVYQGVPSEKTDVYSFGVLLLEVATGRRPIDDDGTVLVDWVWRLWENGKLIEAIDLRLSGKSNGEEIERMLMAGLSCVHPEQKKRPLIKEATKILIGEAPLPLLPVRKPTVRIQSLLPENFEEMLNFDRHHSPCIDDASWMTPRSHFS